MQKSIVAVFCFDRVKPCHWTLAVYATSSHVLDEQSPIGETMFTILHVVGIGLAHLPLSPWLSSAFPGCGSESRGHAHAISEALSKCVSLRHSQSLIAKRLRSSGPVVATKN